MQLILASKSSRRVELLQSLNLKFLIVAPDIDESVLPNETPENYVKRLASQKALAVAQRTSVDQSSVIIAADTIVLKDGEIFGKPDTRKHAQEMLTKLSNATHQVLTGFAILTWPQNELICDFESTAVQFKLLTPQEISAYIATGEPMDKAGAYGIQGKGAVLVSSTNGSFTNVVGLPLERIEPIVTKILRNPSQSASKTGII